MEGGKFTPSPSPPYLFLNNSEAGYTVSLPLSNYLLETSILNSVYLIHSSPQVVDKTHTGPFNPDFLVILLINKSCLNSRTSYDIDINLGPLSKLDVKSRNSMISKNFGSDIMSINYHVNIIFPFLQQVWRSAEAWF